MARKKKTENEMCFAACKEMKKRFDNQEKEYKNHIYICIYYQNNVLSHH